MINLVISRTIKCYLVDPYEYRKSKQHKEIESKEIKNTAEFTTRGYNYCRNLSEAGQAEGRIIGLVLQCNAGRRQSALSAVKFRHISSFVYIRVIR